MPQKYVEFKVKTILQTVILNVFLHIYIYLLYMFSVMLILLYNSPNNKDTFRGGFYIFAASIFCLHV